MTLPASTSVKKQLTDATLIDQADRLHLDTARNETVSRHNTVRSMRHAYRRLISDAGSGKLFARTLAGSQVRAMVDEAATTPVAISEYVSAVTGVVTGNTSSFTDFAPDSDVKSHDWKTLLSQVTVLYTDGRYYIDDVGFTGLHRASVPASPKEAIRRILSITDGGEVRLNTMSGKIILDLAALTASTASLGDIKTILDGYDAATTTSSSTVTAVTGVPTVSIRQMIGSVLRQEVPSANRVVRVDDVGTPSSTLTSKPRYSRIRTMLDLFNADGTGIRTFSGQATKAIAEDPIADVEDFIEAIQAAVA
jgi:hypothetical protein